jgi:hypothetical protein
VFRPGVMCGVLPSGAKQTLVPEAPTDVQQARARTRAHCTRAYMYVVCITERAAARYGVVCHRSVGIGYLTRPYIVLVDYGKEKKDKHKDPVSGRRDVDTRPSVCVSRLTYKSHRYRPGRTMATLQLQCAQRGVSGRWTVGVYTRKREDRKRPRDSRRVDAMAVFHPHNGLRAECSTVRRVGVKENNACNPIWQSDKSMVSLVHVRSTQLRAK